MTKHDEATLPLVVELLPPPAIETALRRLSCLPHCVLFDSARRDAALGRYSFLAADPFAWLELPADGADGISSLAAALAPFVTPTVAKLPPFQGGAAGLFSYDLGRSLERLPTPQFDEFGVPALAIGIYDVVLAWDHHTDRAWLISQGFPELDPVARRTRAAERLELFRTRVSAGAVSETLGPSGAARIIDASQLAPQFTVPGPAGLRSNFSRESYLAAAAQAREYVLAGDIFQVNLAQRLLFPAHTDSVSLYLRLRQRNPAPFAGFLDLGEFQLVSASPERFLQVVAREVETRPIKGTRQRTARPEADLFAGDELRASSKDRAENVMIVDLLRNDLSRVCTADSVLVSELCRLEIYETVQHLVSVVRGRLRDDCTPLDLLRATFPGGSITGAPKVRAMQIIAELEPTARGAYCGALGYLGFDGTLDSNILIRTITAGRGWWQLPVGGGIVAQSEPPSEYAETWHKAAGLLRAIV